MIAVKQSDRDFAASQVGSNRKSIWEARIKEGFCDDSYWVQKFAMHREYLESLGYKLEISENNS